MSENRRSPSRRRNVPRARPRREDHLPPEDTRPITAEPIDHEESHDSSSRDVPPPPDRSAEPEYPDEDFESQPSFLGRAAEVENQPSDRYSIETHFDSGSGHFTGGILEFPELRAQGPNREVVMADLEAQLGQKLENVRRSGSDFPEPIFGKRYPDTLQINISQTLYRQLDRLSRYEKIALDKLVCELLSRAIERRESRGGGERRPLPPNQGNQGHRHQHPNHRHRNQRPNNHSMRGRGYHESLQNKENFMEYVRNLENRGGNPNWRKK